METTLELPLPHLTKGRFASLEVITDEALFECTGVRIAFTERAGGASEGPFASLNLGDHVGDDPVRVARNRAIVAEAFGIAPENLVVPRQVHGSRIVRIGESSAEAVAHAREESSAGADGLAVEASDVAALLCYADCVPVILVSPSGRFVVVHAGWRGVVNGIAEDAVRLLSRLDKEDGLGATASRTNVYLGPHIHSECFETGEDVRAQFVDRFGSACAPDRTHVDLGAALRTGLAREGVERVCDAGVCTVCDNDRFFSHRAQNGTAGRHGAFAVRKG
ncbi:polyphenol oxidase family protein [Raoultibacter timonensis]|uniref:Multicopper polyphenol oxidase n=1 Tax=Raoultibacter timonensis TaxID=1907662 RepID=A0ABN6MFG1_9ACTN|nr:polyphenol oxidase family protein [Raoultibacter timonensis]BDE96735.1 multicopper polyphenol oxidase [Raoultibacter timonensis]BDF51338.1 multicopper polyphenol oxidase [Raoultibacter timonensis]